MTDYTQHLIHSPDSFLRETLENRMELCGVRNIIRMELFLWDLEMFLQLESILADRIVLKGGAAVQFYLPIHYQRTSVDIDTLFYGSKDELDAVIAQIEEKFKATKSFFKFQPHVPKAPKTRLPLFTYFVDVPSVCSGNELRGTANGKQQIKVEFITSSEPTPMNRIKGDQIFAVKSDKEYNVLPINHLFADKLTTLGPKTIGIQDDRMDEQVKQLYDIHSLFLFNFDALDFDAIRSLYELRAMAEAEDRSIPYDSYSILKDVHQQLYRLRTLDNGSEDSKITWKYIADFLGLYAGGSAIRTTATWAVVGEQLHFLFSLLFEKSGDKSEMIRALNLDKLLLFEHLTGAEKGKQIALFKGKFIAEYGHLAEMPPKILKGKNLNRIFWAIIRPHNLDVLEVFIRSHIVI